MKHQGCELCERGGGMLVTATERLRVVRVQDKMFPAFYRVIWNDHVAEFSDLSDADRGHCMAVVTEVERTLRNVLQPAKVNLASLGNMVPHLHWHVIARFSWDSHFPQAIWGERQRDPDPARLKLVGERLPFTDQQIAELVTSIA